MGITIQNRYFSKLKTDCDSVEYYNGHMDYVCVTHSIPKENPEIIVKNADYVLKGQPLIISENECLHSPISGTVAETHENSIVIKNNFNQQIFTLNDKTADPVKFLSFAGIIGMGGAKFPASLKAKNAASCHTLIINAVECEPFITIDRALLVNFRDLIVKGAEFYSEKFGIKRIILETMKSSNTEKIRKLFPFEVSYMPSGYPQGAEKLILQKHTGKTIYAGQFPFTFGYLIHNTATIRALGKALTEKIPLIERPLTVIVPSEGIYKNIIVPLGVRFRDILSFAGYEIKDSCDKIVSNGLMMGSLCSGDECVNKGTNSIIVLPNDYSRFPEQQCIRCGACFNACPLNLHPMSIAERVKEGAFFGSIAFKGQVRECFLCGACAAVCPKGINLLDYIKKGKECIK